MNNDYKIPIKYPNVDVKESNEDNLYAELHQMVQDKEQTIRDLQAKVTAVLDKRHTSITECWCLVKERRRIVRY